MKHQNISLFRQNEWKQTHQNMWISLTQYVTTLLDVVTFTTFIKLYIKLSLLWLQSSICLPQQPESTFLRFSKNCNCLFIPNNTRDLQNQHWLWILFIQYPGVSVTMTTAVVHRECERSRSDFPSKLKRIRNLYLSNIACCHSNSLTMLP